MNRAGRRAVKATGLHFHRDIHSNSEGGTGGGHKDVRLVLRVSSHGEKKWRFEGQRARAAHYPQHPAPMASSSLLATAGLTYQGLGGSFPRRPGVYHVFRLASSVMSLVGPACSSRSDLGAGGMGWDGVSGVRRPVELVDGLRFHW